MYGDVLNVTRQLINRRKVITPGITIWKAKESNGDEGICPGETRASTCASYVKS